MERGTAPVPTLTASRRLPQYISLAEAGRRVYLDLGARRYNTSLPWFRTSYPNASDYALKVVLVGMLCIWFQRKHESLHNKGVKGILSCRGRAELK